MPGIASAAAAAAADRNDHQFAKGATPSYNSLASSNGFWSKHREDISYNQLQKFWSELSLQARQELLRIDKQTLFEQARKNMYCSRCNGLLLEGFLQIVMYGKSLQQEGAGTQYPCNRLVALKNQNDVDFCGTDGCDDDIQDPSVHPWGGLTTTREGILTALDCYLYSESLKGIQNVFDSARARERERELLYPDACGGGGRGWISQGMGGYGRGHGTRETCALHTARLSVDTLVDFWSALGEETRLSLLRMKEEDFIERLMYRFDSKRFCRDCRRNVIREFKELKELKRMRREPRCTSWFCVADMAFQYEVSHDTVQADWQQTFVDTFGTYHHFEWAVGTGEGKCDILEFENVGLSGRVQVKGLDLSGLNSCYITLRAWKMDGRCTELSVKAHALKGQQCVHCRLVVGDGFVTITRGESIRRFFEHAEEAEEEEEDDDSMDKDGNELDSECSRPQKHAKSPELAREFLLDAATVIFKEQVEKAFREGTARQNAHSIFVCLALKLLEDRVHVACKEIITLEKQMKLLEEEEKEKREEEERKERRRTKEREKKLRRKERLREKEKDREKKYSESTQHSLGPEISKHELTTIADEESNNICNGDFASEMGEAIPSGSLSPDIQDEQLLDEFIHSDLQNHSDSPDGDFVNTDDGMSHFPIDQLKYSRRKLKFRKDFQQDTYSKWYDRRRYAIGSENGTMVNKYEARHHSDNFESGRSIDGPTKQLRNFAAKSNIRNVGPKYSEKSACSGNRIHDRYESHACSCNQYSDFRLKVEPHKSRMVRENKSVFKSESASDMSKPYYRINHNDYMRENCGRSKNKTINGSNAYIRDSTVAKKVWEPMESQKYPRSNSDSDVTLRCSTFKGETIESDQAPESSIASSSDNLTGISIQIKHEDKDLHAVIKSEPEAEGNGENGLHPKEKSQQYKEATDEEGELCPMSRSLQATLDSSLSSSSNSDNCSSCLSEGDSNISSSNPQTTESSASSSSDSDDASQNSEGRETSVCFQSGITVGQDAGIVKGENTYGVEHVKGQVVNDAAASTWGTLSSKANSENGRANMTINAQPQVVLPQLHNQSMQFPIFQSPPMGYYHQSPLSWPAAPTNGFMAFPPPNHYVFASPFGYGLNGNSHLMQYGSLQHPTPQMLNRNHVPVFQSVAHSNGINGKDHMKISNVGGTKEAHAGPNVQRVVSNGLQQRETPATAKKGMNLKTEGSDVRNTGFSLFHFGGPVDIPPSLKSEPASLKEETGTDLSSKLSADHDEGDQTCNKKNSIEEYNLFAASNGIKFSFF